MSNASDFIIKNGVLTEYTGPGGDVVIPDNVISIGYEAFRDCKSLTTVTIPDSVTDIGFQSFLGCVRLTTVNIPDSVTSIGNLAFSGCTSLADDQGFVIVRNVLCQYCGNASAVSIPDSVTAIGNYAFFCCKSLTTVTIGTSVTSIGYEAFRDCKSLTTVNIPDSVTSIGRSAFWGCVSLADEQGFVVVRNVLYQYCGNASAVSIPDGVTSIENSAFYRCESLTSVTIPDGVTSIGEEAFYRCQNLKKLRLAVSAATFVTKHFNYSDELRIDIPDISALPAKFRICAALCYAEDGGNADDPRYASHVKYLKANAGKLIETALNHLPLLSLICRESCIKAKDIDAYTEAVQKTGNAEAIAMILEYQNSKLSGSQKERAAKQKEKQADTVVDRAIARMNQVGIAGLNFVVTGDVETFEKRAELKAFIESQGARLQGSMSAKTDYLIMNDASSNSEKAQKAKALGVEVITERKFNDMAGRAFEIVDGVLAKYRGAGGEVVIPDGVTSISVFAFSDCKSLTAITIPDSVTSIGECAFSGCESLTTVTIGTSVTSIGDNAFWNCKSMTTITIPDSITSIGEEAFQNCKSMTTVTIPDGVKVIRRKVFSYCESLTTVIIPDGVKYIDRRAFDGCKRLTIHVRAGSYAESYAKGKNIPFIAE